MRSLCLVTTLAVVAGCAGATVASSRLPPATLQGGEVAHVRLTEEQVAYGVMAAVAMRQSVYLTSVKKVGLFQGDDPRAPLYPIIRYILENHPYREIHSGQAKIACTVPTRPGLRGGSSGGRRTCGLDVVDVLLQVNSVQIMRDSGYVGGYITEVLPGEDRARSSAYCFIAVWKNGTWIDVRNSLVKEPRDCAADRRH